MTDNGSPLVVGAREAWRRSGFPRELIYAALRDGRLRSIRRGRRFLVPLSELERFVSAELDAYPNGGARPARESRAPVSTRYDHAADERP